MTEFKDDRTCPSDEVKYKCCDSRETSTTSNGLNLMEIVEDASPQCEITECKKNISEDPCSDPGLFMILIINEH
jgi:hypothetical protein